VLPYAGTGRFRFEGYALSPRALYLPRAPLAAGDSASLYNAAALWQVNPDNCTPPSVGPPSVRQAPPE
jgi:hypothetical protein